MLSSCPCLSSHKSLLAACASKPSQARARSSVGASSSQAEAAPSSRPAWRASLRLLSEHALLASALLPSSAWADEVIASYNPAAQSEFITNVAGVLYCGLLAYFLYKVFTRRAASFTSERVGGGKAADDVPSQEEEEDPELVQPVVVTVFNSFLGAVQALGISYVLFLVAQQMDSILAQQSLPEQYTARNIAVTVRTIISGLTYLATFVFAANGVGLTALTLKLAIFGDDEAVAEPSKKPAQELPKIGLTSDYEDVVRAFDEASRIDKKSER